MVSQQAVAPSNMASAGRAQWAPSALVPSAIYVGPSEIYNLSMPAIPVTSSGAILAAAAAPRRVPQRGIIGKLHDRSLAGAAFN